MFIRAGKNTKSKRDTKNENAFHTFHYLSMVQQYSQHIVRSYHKLLCYYLHNYDSISFLSEFGRELGHAYHFLHGIQLL